MKINMKGLWFQRVPKSATAVDKIITLISSSLFLEKYSVVRLTKDLYEETKLHKLK